MMLVDSLINYNYAAIREAIRYSKLCGCEVDINGNLIDAAEDETLHGRMIRKMYSTIGDTTDMFRGCVTLKLPTYLVERDGVVYFPENFDSRNTYLAYVCERTTAMCLVDVSHIARSGLAFNDVIVYAEAKLLDNYARFLKEYDHYIESQRAKMEAKLNSLSFHTISNEDVVVRLVN